MESMDEINSQSLIQAKNELVRRGQKTISAPLWLLGAGALLASLVSFTIVFWLMVVAVVTVFLLSFFDTQRQLKDEIKPAVTEESTDSTANTECKQDTLFDIEPKNSAKDVRVKNLYVDESLEKQTKP